MLRLCDGQHHCAKHLHPRLCSGHPFHDNGVAARCTKLAIHSGPSFLYKPQCIQMSRTAPWTIVVGKCWKDKSETWMCYERSCATLGGILQHQLIEYHDRVNLPKQHMCPIRIFWQDLLWGADTPSGGLQGFHGGGARRVRRGPCFAMFFSILAGHTWKTCIYCIVHHERLLVWSWFFVWMANSPALFTSKTWSSNASQSHLDLHFDAANARMLHLRSFE